MRLVTMALLAPALSQALFVDYDLPHGAYAANASHYSGLISPVRQANNDLVNLAPRGRGRVVKEQTPIPGGGIFCHSKNEALDTSDYQIAISLLFESSQFWIPAKSVRYALYGNSVAYICNEGKLNSGSLLEYMQAMDEIDDECGVNKAGKRTIRKWAKYYGRAVRGAHICELEGNLKDQFGGRGGLNNDLDDKVKAGCKSHLNGFLSIFDGWQDPAECYDFNAREGRRKKLQAMFPWYKKKTGDDRDYKLPYSSGGKQKRKEEKGTGGEKEPKSVSKAQTWIS